MKAQVIHSFGNPSVFSMIDLPTPELQPGHVLIKVHATSVNPIDYKIRNGMFPAIAPDFPAILHGDVAGTVEAVGEDVTSFKKGDEVYGCAGGFRGLQGGALAEFLLADAKLIAKKPPCLSMREAAALPLVCITAWESLFEKAKLARGMDVLIHGGLGGVGHIAIQLAKWCGAKVYTTVRKDGDIPIARSLGADEVINFEKETVETYKTRLTNGYGFDVVFDTVGGDNLATSFAAAKFNGQVVTIAGRSTVDLSLMQNNALSLHCVLMLWPIFSHQQRQRYHDILEKVAEIANQGQLKPLLDPCAFKFQEVAKAHEWLESGQAHGKVTLSIQGE